MPLNAHGEGRRTPYRDRLDRSVIGLRFDIETRRGLGYLVGKAGTPGADA